MGSKRELVREILSRPSPAEEPAEEERKKTSGAKVRKRMGRRSGGSRGFGIGDRIGYWG
jgi:hypothetical protein